VKFRLISILFLSFCYLTPAHSMELEEHKFDPNPHEIRGPEDFQNFMKTGANVAVCYEHLVSIALRHKNQVEKANKAKGFLETKEKNLLAEKIGSTMMELGNKLKESSKGFLQGVGSLSVKALAPYFKTFAASGFVNSAKPVGDVFLAANGEERSPNAQPISKMLTKVNYSEHPNAPIDTASFCVKKVLICMKIKEQNVINEIQAVHKKRKQEKKEQKEKEKGEKKKSWAAQKMENLKEKMGEKREELAEAIMDWSISPFMKLCIEKQKEWDQFFSDLEEKNLEKEIKKENLGIEEV